MFNVYRLKENPTWVRFGPRAAPAEESFNTTTSFFSASTRPTPSTLRGVSADNSPEMDHTNKGSKRRGYHQATAPSFSPGLTRTSSDRAEAETLVAAGVAAALRHERQQAQQREQQSGQRTTRTSVSASSSLSSIAKSANAAVGATSCASVAPTRAARSTYPSENTPARGVCTAAPSYQSSHPSSFCGNCASFPSYLRDRTNLPAECKGTEERANAIRASRASAKNAPHGCTQGSSQSSLCGPGATDQTEVPVYARPSVSTAPSSGSRATVTHLSGPAAFVDVEGPFDSLYVPLRRPAPQNCEATRQHFSIFEAEGSERVGLHTGRSDRRGVTTRVHQVDYAPLSVAQVRRGGAGGGDGLLTSNSLYGQGC
ncbi:hypothetical protein ABB37_00315 [Leptomonas pyrrhocoris]|uniref:Uncharacterized protein n=1 Tax=Leptomonas pyrrhocoris TaxID=157538 RepID=A0A0N0E052_LEPPY|nr:hypothetical protein ABB37_00315 [Leptomonas pyrrhocoris]XP_015664482.1 hypothetical protein ABB37_00315 [Leptomonas pyrrhocoris]KPA86042.1 hypothetical protein ABB37_00315 [Leptomonas pyrrhocoris]KPA86043.1 hypothetical protein ABB37_00315 [Leptomonas pyrrhocoris]|eukprot:XP_015664481.1 hypothetical protein ABB37_00315 [Leptomonas pyrrhocoris]